MPLPPSKETSGLHLFQILEEVTACQHGETQHTMWWTVCSLLIWFPLQGKNLEFLSFDVQWSECFVKLTHGPTVFIEDALQKIMQVIFLARPQSPSKRWRWTEDKSKVKINSCLVFFSFL